MLATTAKIVKKTWDNLYSIGLGPYYWNQKGKFSVIHRWKAYSVDFQKIYVRDSKLMYIPSPQMNLIIQIESN